ncbi:MAG: hypothetical protein KC491_08090 [Dehalococcoidia bacterium]|nr:hypothetical protein [Dehalococcoidia bacterium]
MTQRALYKYTFTFIAVAIMAVTAGYVMASAGSSPTTPSARDISSSRPSESDRDGAERPTVEEHEAVVQATAECMRDAGLRVVLEPGHGNRASSLGFEIDTLDDAPEAEGIVEACREQTGLTEIEIARATDPARDDPARVTAFLRLFKECLAQNGVVPNARTMGEFELAALSESLEGADFMAFARCGQRADEETPIVGW